MRFKTYAKYLLSVLTFFLIVELGSAFILRGRPQNHAYEQVFHELEPSQLNAFEKIISASVLTEGNRASVIARRLVDAGIEKYREMKPVIPDPDLLREGKTISLYGANTKKQLFGERHLFTPDLDDVFQKLGATSGKIVYSQRIVTDSHGRRTSDQGSGNPAFNLVFLGCSFTFGEGVQTSETFPSQVARAMPGARAFNTGMHGLSPSHVLRNIIANKDRFLKGSENLPTIVIYTWIDDHLYRTVSTMKYLHRSPDIDPKFDPGVYLEDGKLRLEKDYFQGLTSHQISYQIGKLNFIKLLGLDFPRIKEDHYELISHVFKETRHELKKLNPEIIGFFVAPYPYGNNHFKKLKPHLEKFGIEYFDYSDVDLKTLMAGRHNLIHDQHPSADANMIYASLLKADLLEKFPQLIRARKK